MRYRQIGQAAALASCVLGILIAGCGEPGKVEESSSAGAPAQGKSPSAATTATLPTPGQASESTGTGTAATRTAGDAPATRHVAETAAKPSVPPKPPELADARQLSTVLDLRRLPAPDGAVPGDGTAMKLDIRVPLSVVPAVEYYFGKLEGLGWKRSGPQTAESITEAFGQATLGKDGYLLSLTAMPGKPKECVVTIEHLGNLDARTLPRLAGAEEQFSTQASSLYFARAKVDEATAALQRLMKSDGWQEYGQDAAQAASRVDASDLLFRKKCYSVRLFISKPAGQPDKVAVQSSVATLAHELPAPQDAKNIQIQDSRWRMTCEVPQSMAATAEYYRKTMPNVGFSAPPHETSLGKSMTLSFESKDHDLVLVSLKTADQDATQVKIEGYSAAFREAMKKAEIAAKAKQEADAKAAAQAKAERAKTIQEASEKQDAMIDSAIGNALKEATQPSKQTDLSKKIQADVKAQLDKALKGAGATDPDNSAK